MIGIQDHREKRGDHSGELSAFGTGRDVAYETWAYWVGDQRVASSMSGLGVVRHSTQRPQ